ncbi:MAG: DUF1800 domain-containing protein [Planctomycetes bacterium]|nr:DUF1800 domain-containing protein [Planctomycetota bacterium]MCB9830679.1 DUF1800 domain-containing protein [Planctomycetota bacterium]MCB9900611.1 DUF1800 domain-containing protein [Planctomycetota bacterium]
MRDQMEGERAIAHLLRRTVVAPDAALWAASRGASYDDVVEGLLTQLDAKRPPDPAGFDPYLPGAIQQLWLERMVAGSTPFADRVAFFWHDHFATSDAKIQDPLLMWRQQRLLRDGGGGSWRELLRGVARDVAMIRWLDGNSNRRGHANENFGRELQELFVLGIGRYSEDDVREVARAFTGWGSRHHEFVMRPEFHDDGDKTVHGRTGPFDGDDVIDILLEQPAAAEHLARRLLRWFVTLDPRPEDVSSLADVVRGEDFHLRPVLGYLLRSEAFRDPSCEWALVRSPVDQVVATWRVLGLRALPGWVHASLDRMGQILFRPPSVKGWTQGTGWLSSGALVERLALADRASELALLDGLDAIERLAYGPETPASLVPALAEQGGRDRARLLLGSPEFQRA